MLCSDNVWSLKFPADKENNRWVLCNHFTHAHAGLLIYLCITQEGAVGFTKLQLFGFCISVLSRHQRSSPLHDVASLCCFPFPCELPVYFQNLLILEL